MNNIARTNLSTGLVTAPNTAQPEQRPTTQETQSLGECMLELLTNTNDLTNSLENIVAKVHAGHIQEIIGNIMPMLKLLEILQDEHEEVERVNTVVGNDWVEKNLENVGRRLQVTEEGLWKLAFLEDPGDSEPLNEDERGERHYELALRQMGSFGTMFCYGV